MRRANRCRGAQAASLFVPALAEMVLKSSIAPKIALIMRLLPASCRQLQAGSLRSPELGGCKRPLRWDWQATRLPCNRPLPQLPVVNSAIVDRAQTLRYY
jgi:hypothetical protein